MTGRIALGQLEIHVKDFGGKLAVITGGGTGMGRALARQLVAEGCDVAMCDISADNMAETARLCTAEAPQGVRVSTFVADVANEDDVLAFRDHVLETHQTDHVDLLFNNAGVGGGGSFALDGREEWERTFNICWFGVYNNARAFMPLLMASEDAHMVNTSSVNGFWASLGPRSAHSAYSAAKFAVKGFSEALINDFKVNAPHVKVSVVMPGHIGTAIARNSRQVLSGVDVNDMSAADIANARARMARIGLPVEQMSDEQIRAAIAQQARDFEDKAPTTAAEAASVILNGVREERWRILIGDDAEALDRLVREDPENAYTEAFMERLIKEGNWGLGQ